MTIIRVFLGALAIAAYVILASTWGQREPAVPADDPQDHDRAVRAAIVVAAAAAATEPGPITATPSLDAGALLTDAGAGPGDGGVADGPGQPMAPVASR